jgi:hypothetical protein
MEGQMPRYTLTQINEQLADSKHFAGYEAFDLLSEMSERFAALLGEHGFLINLADGYILTDEEALKDVRKIAEHVSDLADEPVEEDCERYDIRTDDDFDYHGGHVLGVVEAIEKIQQGHVPTPIKPISGIEPISGFDEDTYKTGSIIGLSARDISVILGFLPNGEGDGYKVTKEWTFRVIGLGECAIWDWKGSEWSTFGPHDLLRLIFGNHYKEHSPDYPDTHTSGACH